MDVPRVWCSLSVHITVAATFLPLLPPPCITLLPLLHQVLTSPPRLYLYQALGSFSPPTMIFSRSSTHHLRLITFPEFSLLPKYPQFSLSYLRPPCSFPNLSLVSFPPPPCRLLLPLPQVFPQSLTSPRFSHITLSLPTSNFLLDSHVASL